MRESADTEQDQVPNRGMAFLAESAQETHQSSAVSCYQPVLELIPPHFVIQNGRKLHTDIYEEWDPDPEGLIHGAEQGLVHGDGAFYTRINISSLQCLRVEEKRVLHDASR